MYSSFNSSKAHCHFSLSDLLLYIYSQVDMSFLLSFGFNRAIEPFRAIESCARCIWTARCRFQFTLAAEQATTCSRVRGRSRNPLCTFSAQLEFEHPFLSEAALNFIE